MAEIETSHEGRVLEAKDYQERKVRKARARKEKPLETWYELSGQLRNKVVKKTRHENGNVSSVLAGKVNQVPAEIMKQLRK